MVFLLVFPNGNLWLNVTGMFTADDSRRAGHTVRVSESTDSMSRPLRRHR